MHIESRFQKLFAIPVLTPDHIYQIEGILVNVWHRKGLMHMERNLNK